METLNRKTVNFDQRDSQLVAPFLDASTTEHAALESMVGRPLSSDSAELRALVLLGVRHVREAMLEQLLRRQPGELVVIHVDRPRSTMADRSSTASRMSSSR